MDIQCFKSGAYNREEVVISDNQAPGTGTVPGGQDRMWQPP